MAVVIWVIGLRRRATLMRSRRWGVVRSGAGMVRRRCSWRNRGEVGRVRVIESRTGAATRSLLHDKR
jgi:hypothetical protein